MRGEVKSGPDAARRIGTPISNTRASELYAGNSAMYPGVLVLNNENSENLSGEADNQQETLT